VRSVGRRIAAIPHWFPFRTGTPNPLSRVTVKR
jgi:hypothetical protein